ncbi:isocitrate lyase/phosphoenolpyruvate mutase family protein [Phytoactinopolyspora alkaliphila]|uniref:Isocitrate lyase/phosphoenolpyruvate mutase family protein n=1 Tax=Phytoactinopolyspora alkaliphila TaxID=1783498 RepID=A0A6N9YME5_9ACTN|nr:isocitrate lyase/phosphoenolpyruvate mutase family protein [Phytoactinopolyspora alkaliphila]NED96028.1 isocitrate lyase/phosphoenolpyruvate mutase family protein [Phytoactinopolyspora alkaliphila]
MSNSDVFRTLHSRVFVMPNAWDVGSARLLESLGFAALATTSSGHAASLGRTDQSVHRDELLRHVDSLAAAVSVPVSADSEGCFPDEPGGVARTVELLGQAGAAGCSIEDFDPGVGLLPLDIAAGRVSEAASAAAQHGLVLTARAENHLYGVTDLDDTIQRLLVYRAAGADVVYAPGLSQLADIRRVAGAVDAPLNVLAVPGIPPVAELGAAGVRRISTGGSLAWVAYGALASAGRELLTTGTTSYLEQALTQADRGAAFG